MRAGLARATVWAGYAFEAARQHVRARRTTPPGAAKVARPLSGHSLGAGALYLAGAALDVASLVPGPVVDLGIGAAVAGVAAHAVVRTAGLHGVSRDRTALLRAALERACAEHDDLLAVELLQLYCALSRRGARVPGGALALRGATPLIQTLAAHLVPRPVPALSSLLRAASATRDATRAARFVAALEHHTRALCAPVEVRVLHPHAHRQPALAPPALAA